MHIRICILCLPGLPRMVVIRDYSGIPSPHCGPPLSIHAGDVIELMFADLHSSWWQVRVTQLILVLSQHLWLYEKITCYGSRGLARCTRCLCSVISLNWRRMSSPRPFLLIGPAIWQRKNFQRYKKEWHQLFVSLWPRLCIYITYITFFCHILCQVSHKYAIMMSSASIRSIS